MWSASARISGRPPDTAAGVNPKDWIEWQFKAVRPGKYTLSAEIASPGSPGFMVAIGTQDQAVVAPSTGSYTRYQKADLGTFEITRTGTTKLTIHAVPDGWSPFNLRAIKMSPAGK